MDCSSFVLVDLEGFQYQHGVIFFGSGGGKNRSRDKKKKRKRGTHHVLNTGIRSTHQHDNANGKNERIERRQQQVLLLMPLALLDELEPHPRREVKGEAANKQARAD